MKAANLKQAYVSNSRFRDSQTILTVDKDAAYQAMASDSERPLALEITKPDENVRVETQASKVRKGKLKMSALDWNVIGEAPKIRL